MTWLAMTVVAMAWTVQQFDARALLWLPSSSWALAALTVWQLAGGRAALIVVTAALTLVRAGWWLDTQLPAALAGRDILVRGVVCDFPRPDTEAVRLTLDTLAPEPYPGAPDRLHLSWYAPAPPLRPGERWQLLVRLKPPRGLANPGAFDFEQWLYARGMGATGYVRASVLNRRLAGEPADCPVGRLRGALSERMQRALAGRPGSAYVLGLTVGATQWLERTDWDLLRRTGTSHLMSVSGLHIAMVTAPCLVLAGWWRRLRPGGARSLGWIAVVVIACAYGALAGLGVGVVRALLMLAAGAMLVARRREVALVDVLAMAAVGTTWLRPTEVLAAGFWLSFLAVAWLVLAAMPHRWSGVGAGAGAAGRRAPPPRLAGTRALLRAQLVLGLGLAPLTVAFFSQVSLVAPVANLVAVPVFGFLVMPLALAGLALLAPAPGLAAMSLKGAAAVTALLVEALGRLATWPYSAWQPPPPTPLTLMLAGLAALVICWWRPLPARTLAAVLLLPATLGTVRPSAALRVTVMDVGQGLAVLVQTRRHALVYDTGPGLGERTAGESVVVPVLRAAGLSRLDAVLISHDDNDHRGGADAVRAAFPQARFLAAGPPHPGDGAYAPCRAGLAWTWDDIDFLVLSPAATGPADTDNDASCVLAIAGAGARVLLPGDIEGRREEWLARTGRLTRVDLVVAPHHGSRTSSSAAFIAATRPSFVVFPVGFMNRWGFPATEVRNRWEASGACLLDTAASGAITLVADGTGGLQLSRLERRDGRHLWTSGSAGAVTCRNAGDP